MVACGHWLAANAGSDILKGGDDQDQVTNQSFLNLVVFGMEV